MGIVASYPVWNVLDVPLPGTGPESVVVFPTETVYGIGAFATNEAGIERLYAIKRRENKPMALHLANPSDVFRYALRVSPVAERALHLYCPGPLMMIFAARADAGIPARALQNGRVGIRVVSNFVTASLINVAGAPLVATSANISGGPSPRNFFDVPEELVSESDLAIDNGPTLYQKDSTVVDFSGEIPVVLREGAITAAELSDVLTVKVERN